MNRSVSVVINTYNRAASLAVTLDALTRQRWAPLEVVVVNGPSTDDTEAVVAAHGDRVKLVRCPQRNLSVSRNLGIRAASGEIVAFIDDDAYPEPAWISKIVPAFDDPEVVAAGGPVFDHTGHDLQARYSLANRLGHAWVEHGDNPSALYANPFTHAFVYPIGTNAFFRRSALVAIGGFDEEYEYYLDETDVCVRLIERGGRIQALDDGFVYHKFLASDVRTPQRAIRDRYAILKNRAYFALRHGLATSSMDEVAEAIWAFANHLDHDYRWNVEQGLLTEADYQQFRSDRVRASNDALERWQSGVVKTRPRDWFDDPDTAALREFRTADELRAEPLHIVLLSQQYPPGGVDGIGRHTHTLATGLARRGHTVRVLTRSGTHHRVDLEEGVWVHRVKVEPAPPPAGIDTEPLLWDASASLLAELERIDAMDRVDVVEAPNWDSEGLAVLLSGRFRYVQDVHTSLASMLKCETRFDAASDFFRRALRMEAMLYRRAPVLRANSQAALDTVAHDYGLTFRSEQLLSVIPLTVPRPAPASAPASASPADGPDIVADITAGTTPDGRARPTVLFVGRLEARKGIDTLLATVPRLCTAFPEARFVLAGDHAIPGPDGRTYKAAFEQGPFGSLVGDRVHFLGRVSDDDKERLLAACDVFVCPSRFESFGLVALEAWNHAKPVVATDTGGLAEIVTHDVDGLLVPPGDADALEAALARLLASPETAARLGAAGFAALAERFEVDTMVERFEALYRRVVAEVTPALAIDGADGSTPVADDVRSLGLPVDIGAICRCVHCGGRTVTVPDTVDGRGRCKDGTIRCPACRRAVGRIADYKVGFFPDDVAAAGPDGGRAEPLRVPALGEIRHDLGSPAVHTLGAWGDHGGLLLSDGRPDDVLVIEALCTDITVRMLHHPCSGKARLFLDGAEVATIDLFQDAGSTVFAHTVGRNLPYGRHRVEIRPAGPSVPGSVWAQVAFQEAVCFGPEGTDGFAPPAPINRGNPYGEVIERELAAYGGDLPVLEVGGGDRRRADDRVVNFEYLRFELADAYGDLHTLPFADDTFGLVFTQAVFEHLRNPFEAAAELMRVAAPGALIVTDVAFLQPLHAVPYHYFNMTLWGVEELFPGCEVVERTWQGALADTVDWLLRAVDLPAKVGAARIAAVVDELRELDKLVTFDELKTVASGVVLVVRMPPAAP